MCVWDLDFDHDVELSSGLLEHPHGGAGWLL